MRRLDLLSGSDGAPQFVSIGTVQTKGAQFAAVEACQENFIIPTARGGMAKGNFHFPFQILSFGAELDWRLACADAEPTGTAELRPVGLRGEIGNPSDCQE